MRRLNRIFRGVPRPLKNRARRLLADLAHAALGIELWAVQHIGFDRVLAFANRRRHRLLTGALFMGLSRAVAGIDRVVEMRFAWKARWISRDFAVVTVIAALNSQQKNAAVLWWARRPVKTALARNVLDEFTIDTYARMNDFDAVARFVRSKKIDPAVRARALAEVALRHGETTAFLAQLRAMSAAGSEKRRPLLRWLVRFVDRDERPSDLLPAGSIDRVLGASAVVQGRDDHAALRQLLLPSQRSRLASADWSDYRSAVLGSMRARAWQNAVDLALAPVSPPPGVLGTPRHVALTISRSECLAATGRAQEALAIVVQELDQLVAAGATNGSLRLLVQAARRFPTSLPLLERAPDVFRRASMRRAAHTAAAWAERYGSPRPDPQVSARRCFIVANGPSVGTMPLSLLAGEDIFVVNRGMQATEIGLPAPRFLVVSDVSVYRDYWREIDAAAVEALYLSGPCLVARPQTLGANVRPYGTTSLQLSVGGLMPSPGLYHIGATVVLSACQIAYFLGYREINVLGVDLSYSGPVSHFYGSDMRGVQRLATFRTGDNGEKWVNDSFAHLRSFLEARGVIMRNVGVGGNLHALPRERFEDVLADSVPALAFPGAFPYVPA